MSLGQKLQSVPRWALYLLLILVTSIPLLVPVALPNEPNKESVDFYTSIMNLPEGSTIIIASDWTNSTRGESAGSFQALVRLLMRKKVKFAVYSTGDPQAPEVARKVIELVNREREAKSQPRYERFKDWISLGYFASSEGTTGGISNNIRGVWETLKDTPEGKTPTSVWQSEVFKDVKTVKDIKLLVNVTASKTADIIVERLFGKIPLAFMVTGVMVPETFNYYSSGQISGLVGGLKGVYDLEQLMEKGLNGDSPYKSAKHPEVIEGFKGDNNIGNGTRYYPALHFAIFTLILAVVIGNIGMYLSRKEGK